MSNDSTLAVSTTTTTDPITADIIPEIDLRKFSHTELVSLSLSSALSRPTSRNDVASPKIDRSVINESAGGRKQTFTRIRLAKPGTPAPALPQPSSSRVRRREEDNSRIVAVLKQLFDGGDDGAVHSFRNDAGLHGAPVSVGKRGRGRGRVGSGGVVEGFGRLEDPFGGEIRRRTTGLESEKEFKGYLAGLIGEWVDLNMEARIVDARKFGEVLPPGWKIVVGLERRDDHGFLKCQRYISPDGRDFLSCKEASAYLLSSYGHQNTQDLKS